MKKSGLRSGMVVKTRADDVLLVVEAKGVRALIGLTVWNPIRYYDEDLLHDKYGELDIMEVYEPEHGSFSSMTNLSNKKPIWVREPKKKMTVSQIEKELGYEIEIVRED